MYFVSFNYFVSTLKHMINLAGSFCVTVDAYGLSFLLSIKIYLLSISIICMC